MNAISDDRLDAIADRLADTGWAVCRDFLAAGQIRALAAELRACEQAGTFRAAGVGVGAELSVRPDIRNDRVHWLDEAAQTPAEAPYFAALERLRLAINCRLFFGLFGFEGHMTIYPPGSFYRKHLDQFRGVAHRKVSAILYLNEAWQPEHGGQLRIYLEPSGEGDFLDVLPEGGTLALFLSDRFHHEVLPATRERLSITGWFKVRT